jgi:hypothetical protein
MAYLDYGNGDHFLKILEGIWIQKSIFEARSLIDHEDKEEH